jgi:hypothetical protein
MIPNLYEEVRQITVAQHETQQWDSLPEGPHSKK